MTGRHLLITATAAIIGFALGVLVPHQGSRPDPSAADPSKAPHLKTGLGISGEKPTEENGHTPLKSRVREQSASAKPKSRQISVPLDSIVPILKQRQFSYQDFMRIDGALDSALTMLGVVDPERQEVKAVIESTRAKLLEAEKTHIKIAQSDSSGVVLDQSGMAEVVPAIISETQSKLRDSLSPDLGEALIDSIDWENFYTQSGDYGRKISFSITRNPSGSLGATFAHGGGTMTSGLTAAQYPDNGSPIPAAALFEKRWRPFLENVSLLPVDAK